MNCINILRENFMAETFRAAKGVYNMARRAGLKPLAIVSGFMRAVTLMLLAVAVVFTPPGVGHRWSARHQTLLEGPANGGR
jgi:hypothetical protein